MTDIARDLPGLDAAKVEDWMLRHIPRLEGPLEFELIGGGHSNLTYATQDATRRRLVVRRPPLGDSGASAHDMSREYKVIAALAGTEVPVPAAVALCDDESVNGSPFYVMSHVEGHVIDNP